MARKSKYFDYELDTSDFKKQLIEISKKMGNLNDMFRGVDYIIKRGDGKSPPCLENGVCEFVNV